MAGKFGGTGVKCYLLQLSWRAIFNPHPAGMSEAEPQNGKGPLKAEPDTLQSHTRKEGEGASVKSKGLTA